MKILNTMLKKQSTRRAKYYEYILIILFGTASTILLLLVPLDYFKLTLSNQLSFQADPVNLLSIFINAALAVYVLRVLNRTDESDKIERELLIKFFVEFECEFTKNIQQITAFGGIESKEVAAIFRKNSMALQGICILAKSKIPATGSTLISLEKSVTVVRELLSEIPKNGEIEDGVRLDGTLISYSPKRVGDVAAGMGAFKTAIFEVICSINRS